MNNQPDFTPTFVNAEETQADFDAREALKPLFNQLNSLKNMIDDTILVLGSDLYQANLSYYQNVKLLASRDVNGAKAIYNDLAAQFPRNTRGKKAIPQEEQ